ncbi:MAG: 3-oxoacyl-ACP reductase FabG [Burkholderiaceae bacterium]|nr:3-oxoacyl-ACP reductase FabG [Burkholderiaceae bacterium]
MVQLFSVLAHTKVSAVLVTGSSRGIGRAIALRAARDGYDVWLHHSGRTAAVDAVADEVRGFGRAVTMLAFDVADRGACKQVLDAHVKQHGAPYAVVLNAGIARDQIFPALTAENWDSVIRTNLDGFYNVLHPLVMPMIRQRRPGRIVTLASVSAQVGNRGQVNYSASKAGVIGATRSLALELASRNITVNCVAPGLIATDMTRDLPVEEIMKMIPAGRLGEPDEVAATVAFLISPEAAYITRQVIGVNGGLAA